MPKPAIPVITIDGPAAVGKGTVARAVAKELHFHHLDSGRHYRCAGYWVLQAEANVTDTAAVLAACTGPLADPQQVSQLLTSTELDDETRVGSVASQIAQLPQVRDAVNAALVRACRLPGMVADGRDMGTTVFPQASLKIFLDAEPHIREARAKTRAQASGGAKITDSLADYRRRNARDSQRTIAPIVPATDACVIATDSIDASAVTEQVIALYRQRQVS